MFEEKKGYEYLFEAVSLLNKRNKNFKLDVIGDGELREKYKKIIDELNLKDRITLHGIKNKLEISKYIQNCDFFSTKLI